MHANEVAGLKLETPVFRPGNRFRHLAGAMAAIILSACFSDKATHPSPAGPKYFPQGVEGLESVRPTPSVELKDGDTLRVTAAPVKKTLMGREVRMLAYNGSIPGPLIRIHQGAEITLILKNKIGIPTILHSHGVRLANLFDGTADVQKPIADGDSFSYTLKFPDPGLFWYHPHFREDYAKELGLYGNFLVIPKDTSYWYPVNREAVLMLDDFFLDTAKNAAPFRTDDVDRTMMGRFGNVFLVNGDTAFEMTFKRNDVVRFYTTNACNARVLNVGIADSNLAIRNIKIVGSDNGQYEYFDTAASALLAPAERKIFEAQFTHTGIYYLTHHILKSPFNNDTVVTLARVRVLPDSADTDYSGSFLSIDSSKQVRRDIDSLRRYADPFLTPDKFLELTGTMGGMAMKVSAAAGEPISIEAKGIEWVDHMAAMNSASDTKNMHWVIRDSESGLENHAINWSFKRGMKVKIRIHNSITSTHPMPHPIHFHGQRFLVLSVNNIRNLNMAWMAQCHISEHLEAMMMFNYSVE